MATIHELIQQVDAKSSTGMATNHELQQQVDPESPISMAPNHELPEIDVKSMAIKHDLQVDATSSTGTATNYELQQQVDALKCFLATAPNNWDAAQAIRQFLLPSGDYISCVLWQGTYYVTGTDIVRALVFRFLAFGKSIRNMKKFEEGVFSDLRSLVPGTHASLEEPRSEFLNMLYKSNCIRTQKKQKVFFWFSVDHDRLFKNALERDLRREALGQTPTLAVAEEETSARVLPSSLLSSVNGNYTPNYTYHTPNSFDASKMPSLVLWDCYLENNGKSSAPNTPTFPSMTGLTKLGCLVLVTQALQS